MSNTSSAPLRTTTQHYFVPQPSYYPVMLSAAIFFFLLGVITQMNLKSGGYSGFVLMGLAFLVLLYVVVRWFDLVISENQQGVYTRWEDRSFRVGMIWFIFSEVCFFGGFFGALYYVRIISVPDLATGLNQAMHSFTLWKDFLGHWPSAGPEGAHFEPMKAWGLPAINTLLLLSSGVTVTIAHWGLLKRDRVQLNLGLFFTVLLGAVFLLLQAAEYHHAYTELGLTLKSGVYGATFFILTGFHGFHVTLGAVMLSVILVRSFNGHFSPDKHFAFEAVAWYWHFVDVVWLLLFIFVYWL